LALFTVLAVSGCASIQQAVDKVRGTEAPAAAPERSVDVPSAPVETPAPPPAKPAPRTKPAVREPAKPAPAPTPAPAVKRAPPSSPAIPGPAWLKKCQSVQLAGGVVRCDADLLLAKPSPTVQVFTRDPKRAVEGQIRLRSGLPRIYRFYVVP